ncbi:SRPBCC family protein [Streptomyces misionensis]|uniref:SRPBCC family protein n=1 Tax=Streptomyces misionensis TaxID=67331 RepID=UPI00396BBC39
MDATAPVIVRLTAVVDAPPERVWALHTDIDAWADWNTDVDQARLDGPLLPGNSFYWKTHGMDITSTIREVVPGRRLVWGGTGRRHRRRPRLDLRVDRQPGHRPHRGVLERRPVDAAPQQLGQALEQSLTTWLARMKTRAERTD